MTILSRVMGKGNKNKPATACHDLNLPMLFCRIKTCSSAFSPDATHKDVHTFSLSGGHPESVYWKYFTGSSCLSPSGPSWKSGWPNRKPSLSLVSLPCQHATCEEHPQWLTEGPAKHCCGSAVPQETLNHHGHVVTS